MPDRTQHGRLPPWGVAKAIAYSTDITGISEHLGQAANELIGEHVRDYMAKKLKLVGGGSPTARPPALPPSVHLFLSLPPPPPVPPPPSPPDFPAEPNVSSLYSFWVATSACGARFVYHYTTTQNYVPVPGHRLTSITRLLHDYCLGF